MANEIQQPKPYDLVGPDPHRRHRSGFRGDAQLRVHDGHDERTGFFNVGGGGATRPVPGCGQSGSFEASAKDGSEINKVTVPVIYGPRIVPGYIGYRIHVVQRGDTLSAIAAANYGSASAFQNIVQANPLVISDPNRIFVGQELKIPIGA